ncbi:MAG: serine/threonine-protein kinase, partial [Chloroflexota bacterium]
MAEEFIGRQLLGGEYELREILGRGGMATVYRAFSRSLETDVAVKVLAPRLASDAGFRERFHDEARSLAGLHHPNLVEVHHYGEEGDLVYIVMRLVPGGTLKDRLEVIGGPLDLVSTARVVGQVADALQLAHDRGLVHLDIKPVNVLMGRADWALLADFGITRAVGHETTARGRQRYAGTPAYMSPEQWRGDEIDGRSDQYSLAITAYELLTGGVRPFVGQTTDALEHAHLDAAPTRPRDVNPGIPGPVEAVLLRGMAKSPDQRYPRVADFAAALSRAVEATRGVSLETKEAAARLAPNLLGILLLLLVGPLLVGLLPPTTIAGTRLPLRWPFQLLLSILIAALYVGIRWPFIGLLTRAVGSWLSGAGGAWRKGVAASVEGTVTLVYLFGAYWLVGAWIVAIAGALGGANAALATATVLSLAVVIAALVLVVRIFRVAGPVVTAVILGFAWAMAGVLPTGEVLVGGISLANTVKAVVGVGVLALLLATRPRLQAEARRLTGATLRRLAAAALLERTPEQAERGQRRTEDLVGGVVDFLYLLVGDALLLYPIGRGLDQVIGALASAIVVTVLVAVPWIFLTLRLRQVAGTAGIALGVLLGAPVLVTLPVLRQ